MRIRRPFLTLAALLALLPLSARVPSTAIHGSVVAVVDGDTIKVLGPSKTLFKIRLSGIDAPESKQAWGQRSKQHLSDLVYGREVTVLVSGEDRYGREIGKVVVNGLDANLEQVKSGMAWWYAHFAKEQLPGDAQVYSEAESQARAARRGLWGDPNPVAPWDWRRLHN